MQEENKPNVISFFPKDEPYPNQEIILNRIVKAFDIGKAKTVIVQSPVGSGKSPIAICLANYYGGGHILTPRKSLQDQYFEDFPRDVSLLKGMSNYPCFPAASNKKSERAIPTTDLNYIQAINIIEKGGTPIFRGLTCSKAPCRGDKKTFEECTNARKCTYQSALAKACAAKITVSNLHSFIANSLFIKRLAKKPILIVDEAHEMEDIVRGFISSEFTVEYLCISNRMDIPEFDSLAEWVEWFRNPLFTDGYDEERLLEYNERLDKLDEYGMRNFVVSYEEDLYDGVTKFSFEPRTLGNAAETFLLQFGDRRLLMSGTIYDKQHFCRLNGLNEEETVFLKMPSTFPPAACPIILRSNTVSNNSHKHFEKNFNRNMDAIRRALLIYHNVRGLIHAPSYVISARIQQSLCDPRIIGHTPENFAERLKYFLEESPPNAVFISPSCQQGIDLKYDKARFQIILRVPYPSLSSNFMKDLIDHNPPAYTYKALVSFGQMIGRPMRAPNDWGHTILLDDRFHEFLHNNRALLGEDVMKRVKKIS